MPDATIGWGGPSVSGVIGQAPNAMAPGIAAPMGYSSIGTALGNLGAAALGSNQAAQALGLGINQGAYGPVGPAHGWGAPASTLSGLTPAQSLALAQALGYNDTMNTNQAALNDSIATTGQPVSIANQTAADAYGYNSLAQGMPAADPSSMAAAMADAQGYANSQAAPTGYGYGLSLGAPAAAAADDSGGYGFGLGATGLGDNAGVTGQGFGDPGSSTGTASIGAPGEGFSDGFGQGATGISGFGQAGFGDTGVTGNLGGLGDDGGGDAGDAGDGGDGGDGGY